MRKWLSAVICLTVSPQTAIHSLLVSAGFYHYTRKLVYKKIKEEGEFLNDDNKN